MTRASYGVALVMVPGPAIMLVTGRLPGRRARRVARLLGARHLVQAALNAAAPFPGMFTAGAAVDALHATSMLMLATVGRSAHEAALMDAVIEGLFAGAGFSASPGSRPQGDLAPRHPDGVSGAAPSWGRHRYGGFAAISNRRRPRRHLHRRYRCAWR
jgi:hypothetical protein